MRAKIFNLSNCKQGTAFGKCSVKVSRRLGCVNFSLPASRRMDIDTNSRVEFIQDQDRPRDWYIHVSGSADGFVPVEKGHRGGGYFAIKSRPLADAICGSLGFTGKSFSVNVGQQDKNGLWPLITAAVR